MLMMAARPSDVVGRHVYKGVCEMEAVLKCSENDVVDAYWSMLSALSRMVKLNLPSKVTIDKN